MSALTEQFANDVEATEADLSVVFTVAGRGPFTGQKTTPNTDRQMEDDGYTEKADLELIYRLEQFTATSPAPVTQGRIAFTVEKKNFRVGSIRTAEDGVTATAQLMEDI